MAASRGWFITFEGADGVGKSTQVERLRRRLGEAGLPAVVTREPGGTPRAERLRAAILCGAARRFGPLAEAALFAAARADHVERLIGPALARGETVLCDRFIDSTRVYQGVVGAVSSARLAALERTSTGRLRPDLTLVLDLPAALAQGRAEGRRHRAAQDPDRFEREGAGFQAKIAQAFRELAAAEPDRCVLIDASPGPEEIQARVWAAVAARLPIGGGGRG